jgi:hypothetical protein
MNDSTQTKATTIGGALVVLFANISTTDIIKTVVLTAIGAIVSFGISQLMKMLLKWWRTR